MRTVDTRPDGTPVSPGIPHAAKVLFADCSESGLLVATASEDGAVRAWEIASGDLVFQIPRPRSTPIRTFFCEGDKHLLTVYADGRVTSSNIEADDRPIAAIERESRLHSGHRLDRTGTPVVVSAEQLDLDWRERKATP